MAGSNKLCFQLCAVLLTAIQLSPFAFSQEVNPVVVIDFTEGGVDVTIRPAKNNADQVDFYETRIYGEHTGHLLDTITTEVNKDNGTSPFSFSIEHIVLPDRQYMVIVQAVQKVQGEEVRGPAVTTFFMTHPAKTLSETWITRAGDEYRNLSLRWTKQRCNETDPTEALSYSVVGRVGGEVIADIPDIRNFRASINNISYTTEDLQVVITTFDCTKENRVLWNITYT